MLLVDAPVPTQHTNPCAQLHEHRVVGVPPSPGAIAMEVSVLITVAFYVNEMEEGERGHDEQVI